MIWLLSTAANALFVVPAIFVRLSSVCHALLLLVTHPFYKTLSFTNSSFYIAIFYAPGSNDRGHSFCPACLSVVIFNICYNFWTIRDRDILFGMHTQLMMPFQMTPRYLVTLILTFVLKIVFFRLCCLRGLSVSQTHVFYIHSAIFQLGS